MRFNPKLVQLQVVYTDEIPKCLERFNPKLVQLQEIQDLEDLE